MADARPIPEELFLLCADPTTGRIIRPADFSRVIAGGLLAELLLSGAITVADRFITGYRPLNAPDPAAAEMLERLSRAAGKRSRGLRLDSALTRVPRAVDSAALDSLTARGFLTCEPRRLLGLLPYRQFTATGPGPTQAIRDRLRSALQPAGSVADTRPGAGRDLQLAALVGAARLERRLFPGPEGKPTRRAVQELSRTMPIARAVRRVMNSDFAD